MPPVPQRTVAKKAASQPTKKAAAKKAAPNAAPPVMKRTGGAPPPKPDNIVPIGTGNQEYPRLFIYGEPGTWKTILAGTAPNALFLEADRGDTSAARTGSTAEKWYLEDWDAAAEAMAWLMMGGYKHYDFIVMDTVTMFQDSGLNQIMDELVIDKPHRKVYLPDKGEYGQNMNRLNRYVRDLCRLPVAVVCTAHMAMDTDHDGETRYMPQIQGKNMPAKICAYFDIVGHMEVVIRDGAEHSVFSTLKDGKYYTKDRYGVIGKMGDPTIPRILERMRNKPQSVGGVKKVAKKVPAAIKKVPAARG